MAGADQPDAHPMGWKVTYMHTFQGVDPALGHEITIDTSALSQAVAGSRRARAFTSREIDRANLHRGLLNDRLTIRMIDGSVSKLLWVRNRAGTQRLEDALRGWLGARLKLD
jgi:hypothetical protein